jgi:copper(I)-binding protein
MMRQRQRLVAIGTAVGFLLGADVLGGAARAQTPTITASNAWARRAPAMGSMGKMGSMDKMGSDKGGMSQMGGGGNGAVYMTLTNSGSQVEALVSASSDAAQTVELHEVKNDGGVMKMRPVKSIPVPAKGKVELKPGGYHIMLLDLKRDLKAGEKVAVTLKFEHGGEMQVEAAVR